MRAGSASLMLNGISVMDTPQARCPLGLTMGWFFVRILISMPKEVVSDLRTFHGIEFRSQDMLQPGWFKIYLNESQLAYAKKSQYLSLIPVKNYDIPDYKELKKEKSLLVHAVSDWVPSPPAKIVSRMFDGIFVVEGATAEELFEDQRVVKIQKVPVVKAI